MIKSSCSRLSSLDNGVGTANRRLAAVAQNKNAALVVRGVRQTGCS